MVQGPRYNEVPLYKQLLACMKSINIQDLYFTQKFPAL